VRVLPEYLAALSSVAADDSERLRELLELLPELWAGVPADGDGLDAVAVFVRAAYGAGYSEGLEARLS
jgi:hypothetical protein